MYFLSAASLDVILLLEDRFWCWFFCLTFSWGGVGAAILVLEGGVSVEVWGLILSFIVTLSVVSWRIVGSQSFATFDFIFCTAFDQKSVTIDSFVWLSIRLLASSLYLLAHWLQDFLSSFSFKFFLRQFQKCSCCSPNKLFRILN